MMRVGCREVGQVRVFEGIIPGDLFTQLIDLVAVVEDHPGVKVNQFPNLQNYVLREYDLSLQSGKHWPKSSQYECRVVNERMCLWQGVDQVAVRL
ncbi:MAG: hypothetical protein HY318_13115 [Armatimonadetes bacterium]|nr:hypothetical protein [Armatimonadota bacterium]